MTSNELEIFKQSILDEVRVMMQTTGQVTQYIGARYVPLFAEPFNWDINKEYEPLTIVTNQGNSYTSRQFVPKGVDISDTTFWASTGNYNAQIEQYRQEVAKFDARITAAQNAADSKAPIKHATDSTEYGVGNAVNYGHVKLSDDDTSMTSGANDGIAATPEYVSNAINRKIGDINLSLIGCIDHKQPGFDTNEGTLVKSNQGVCLNNKGEIFTAFVNKENTKCVIHKANPSTDTQSIFTESDILWHCDAFTYDSVDNVFISRTADKVNIYSANNFTLIKTIANFTADCCFDKKENKIYLVVPWSGTADIYSVETGTFNVSKIGSINIPDFALEGVTIQSGNVYNGIYYMPVSTITNKQGIIALNLKTLKFVGAYGVNLAGCFNDGEIESLDFDNDGFMYLTVDISLNSDSPAFISTAVYKGFNPQVCSGYSDTRFIKPNPINVVQNNDKFSVVSGSTITLRNCTQLNSAINANNPNTFFTVKENISGYITINVPCRISIGANVTITGGFFIRGAFVNVSGVTKIAPTMAKQRADFIRLEGAFVIMDETTINALSGQDWYTSVIVPSVSSSLIMRKLTNNSGVTDITSKGNGPFMKTTYTQET